MNRRTFFKSSALMVAFAPTLTAMGWNLGPGQSVETQAESVDWVAWETDQNIIERCDLNGFPAGWTAGTPWFKGIPASGKYFKEGDQFNLAGQVFRVDTVVPFEPCMIVIDDQDGLLKAAAELDALKRSSSGQCVHAIAL